MEDKLFDVKFNEGMMGQRLVDVGDDSRAMYDDVINQMCEQFDG